MKIAFNYNRIEPYVFWAVLLVSLFSVFGTTYFTTLDGPAHLYNAKLLNNYSSNPVISTYYSLNNTPSPNFFGHLGLSFFNLFFSSAISEKILILFYLVSFPLSFRYFVKYLSPQNRFFSLIAIPLSYSCLMYMGFYNFSISYTFLFWGMGLYFATMYRKESIRPQYFILLFVMVSLTYLSNVLSFVYFLAAVSVFELHTIILLYKTTRLQNIYGRLLKQLIVVLPSCICLLLFYTQIQFPSDHTPNNTKELFDYLLSFKSLTVYDVNSDILYTRILLAVIIFMIGYIIFKSRVQAKALLTQHFQHLVFLFLTFLILVCYFVIPNDSSAGMMTDRLCNLFFVSLVLWIGSQQHIKLPWLVSIAIIIPHFFLLNIHSKEQKGYNSIAVNVARSAQHIEANSVVLPINLLHKWIFVSYHFTNYLGCEKPLILLDNYEAIMPWFPLNWNLEKMPRLRMNGKESVSGISWPKSNKELPSKEIDYVYILGDTNDLKEEGWQELKTALDSAYVNCYFNKEELISIYKHK